jgi:hypothetical protein
MYKDQNLRKVGTALVETARYAGTRCTKFSNDENDQNTNFAKLPSAKRLFFCITVNFIIQKLKFSKIEKAFASVSLVRGKSEMIVRKIKGESSCLVNFSIVLVNFIIQKLKIC